MKKPTVTDAINHETIRIFVEVSLCNYHSNKYKQNFNNYRAHFGHSGEGNCCVEHCVNVIWETFVYKTITVKKD